MKNLNGILVACILMCITGAVSAGDSRPELLDKLSVEKFEFLNDATAANLRGEAITAANIHQFNRKFLRICGRLISKFGGVSCGFTSTGGFNGVISIVDNRGTGQVHYRKF